jgi:predicted murein hydrolase (TIGR00659 family)
MKDAIMSSAYFGVIISVAGYALGVLLKKKFKRSFLNPLLISIVFVIGILLIFNIDYESYNQGGKYISYLLTPATVCLAIPLYQQLELLKKNKKAILLGILAGVLSSLGSVLALSYLFGLTHQQYVTLLPKSITTAIGIGVSHELGGIETITVAVIIVTGVFGNVIAEGVLRLFKIKDPIAVGLAIGTSAHALGTTKAFELGEIQGAMSSLSIVVTGLITVIGASFFAYLL